MKTVKRDVPGHFCDNENCAFFMHTDICEDDVSDAYSDASYCVSLIGEYKPGWNMLNASGKTYELDVFDKKGENPWGEIEGFRMDSKSEAIEKFKELVKKYSNPNLITNTE